MEVPCPDERSLEMRKSTVGREVFGTLHWIFLHVKVDHGNKPHNDLMAIIEETWQVKLKL